MDLKNQQRRKFVLKLAQSIGALGAVSYAPKIIAKDNNALITSLAIHSGRNKQHVVIELDRSVEHKLFTLSSPDRIVLDIHSAQTNGNLKLNPERPKTLVSRLRYATRNNNDLRIVLDMANKTKAQTKLTKVNGKYRLEVVLDDKNAVVAAAPIKKAAAKKPVVAKKTKARKRRNFVVAIDPGHGGHDSGAVGKHGTYEKDVVLKISRRLKTRIDRTKGMEAFLTRPKDKYLTLRQRIDLAQAKNADLFISVHADANTNKNVNGSSVYVLSEKGASSEMARWLARNENEIDIRLAGAEVHSNNKVLSKVLLDLTQSAAIDDSVELAEQVLSELGTVNRLARKGVESANFGVLRSPDIPSMLVETAFISNPEEERKLKTAKYQNQIAEAVYRGIRSYKVALDERDPRYADSGMNHQPHS
ncbi:N-acetylmuramoyl-L-alanine amidase [Leucothrix arctica]|uniref:N-acetylmuramoyl-L-alanine amidase AmiC n=1 Tax=Leucothrix arctica TaxID=1481894 RepID=A0A317C8T6_9GAMM|nr:N-acetylmuramoyl-L-alanine amidase [Leucothrix arctica]PWQ94651.1 N-acetylmuramoyl-L-alanine amidase [Leucothrix arctica]